MKIEILTQLIHLHQRTETAHAAGLRELAGRAGDLPSDPVARLEHHRGTSQLQDQIRMLGADRDALVLAIAELRTTMLSDRMERLR